MKFTHLLSASLLTLLLSIAKAKDYEFCRDLYGFDCEESDFILKQIMENQISGSKGSLEKICCKLGGGERISAYESDKRVGELIGDMIGKGLSLDGFYVQGSPQHLALFFITQDDTFHSSNSHLLQRYAMAVFYFSLGGPKRWNTCWSGGRYNETFDLAFSDECNHELQENRKAWLSPTHECQWAFIECDRNSFVTGISMTSNVKEETSDVPYFRSTKELLMLPQEITVFDRMTKLDLRNNSLTGTIPTIIGSMNKLRAINLYGNKFSGSIPEDVYELIGMEYLVLGRNSFVGTISPSIGKLTHMLSLYLGYNDLSGSIPLELKYLDRLENLHLVNMNMNGYIPTELCKSKNSTNLYRVDESLVCECCEKSAPTLAQIQCSNNSRASSWYASVDKDLHKYVSMPRGCDWLELHDSPGSCGIYGNLKNVHNEYAINECCYCNQCSDYDAFLDAWGDGYPCQWYNDNEIYGCPTFGQTKNENGIAPRDACCWCGGGYNYGESEPTSDSECSDIENWFSISGDTCESLKMSELISCSTNESLVDENGIAAFTSCCYCGGGFYSTQKPSLPDYLPPDDECVDMEGWFDWYYKNCSWYELNDISGCPAKGEVIGSNGYFAKDACCWCGGGSDFKVPSMSPSVSKSPSLEVCTDFDGWVDMKLNFTCSTIELISADSKCSFYGEQMFSSDLVFAIDACCYCGGGHRNITSNDEDKTIEINNLKECIDIQIPRPWPSHDCGWYDKDPSRCTSNGNDVIYEKVVDSTYLKRLTANDICCICGGGAMNCVDFPDWKDSHRRNPYTCADYKIAEECDRYGKAYFNLGHTASTACCVCGGGFSKDDSNILVNIPEQNFSGELCYSDFNWTDISGDFNCSFFSGDSGDPEVEKCVSFGHVTSSWNINASEACCECQFGYSARGGGYRGELIGKMFRAGFIDNNDVPWLYSYNDTNNDVIKNQSGVLNKFFLMFFESTGLGMIQEPFVKKVDSYEACKLALLENNTDICVGAYWNTSFPTPISEKLYVDQFFLVTRRKSVQLYSVIFGSAFGSFSLLSWFIIVVIIALYGLTVDIVTNADFTRNVAARLGSCGKIGSMLYAATILFIGKRPVQPTEKREEKLAIFGFSIFTLFVIATFTGSITASLVNSPGNVEYTSLDDAVKNRGTICMHNQLVQEFLVYNPGSKDLVSKTQWNNTLSMFDAMSSSSGKPLCDVVIASSDAFLSAQNIDKSICEKYVLLHHETILEVDVVIPISPMLGQLGVDFLTRLNRMISTGWFQIMADATPRNASLCDNAARLDGKDSSVDYEKILFPASISLFFNMLALIVFYRRKREHIKGDEDIERARTSEKPLPHNHVIRT